MQLTRLTIDATCRDKKPSVRRHAMLSRMIDELALVEIDKRTAERAGVLGIEVSVDPLQQLPGSVIAAIGNVGIVEDRAGIAEEVRRHRMLGRNIVLIYDVCGAKIVAILGKQVVHEALRHDRVARAGEKPDAMPREIGGVVDGAAGGIAIGNRDQFADIRGTRRKAAKETAARRCRDRSACDNARASQYWRERDLELNGHVAAR